MPPFVHCGLAAMFVRRAGTTGPTRPPSDAQAKKDSANAEELQAEQHRTRQRINASQAAVGVSLEDIQVEGPATGHHSTDTGACTSPANADHPRTRANYRWNAAPLDTGSLRSGYCSLRDAGRLAVAGTWMGAHRGRS